MLVIGHLRAEKDPFRAALATAYLPEHSQIQVTHLGGALSEEMAETAELAQSKLPRWHWARRRAAQDGAEAPVARAPAWSSVR